MWFEVMTSREDEKAYQAAVLEIWGAEPPASHLGRTVYLAKHQETLVGWVSISDEGEIILLHLLPEYRNDRLGLQLLGQAVSHTRGKGMSFLTLHCPPGGNLGFFQAFGFVEKAEHYEKYIGYQPRANLFENEDL